METEISTALWVHMTQEGFYVFMFLLPLPLLPNRQHQSCDRREDCQNSSVLSCVWQLCTVTHMLVPTVFTAAFIIDLVSRFLFVLVSLQLLHYYNHFTSPGLCQGLPG